ncbi:MAG TPA: M48 family metallopeptidase [Nocardioidaceae bacterium]|nr:M48 family metallopeptidase [Nocardioidaceae bacterium]
MTNDRLARGPACALVAASAILVCILLVVLIPWGQGPIDDVSAGEVFTAAQIDRAESYSGAVRLLGRASLVVSLLVAGLLGFTPLGARLVARLPRRFRLPLAVLAVLLIGRLATLPFSLLIREQRLDNGLTRQAFGGWVRDVATSFGVSWVAMTLLVGLVVILARRAPRTWFLWAGVAVSGLTFIVSFAYPLVVEPLFNKFSSMPDGQLRQSILQLADEEGVAVDDVLVADASRRTTTLNAYVSGFGDSRRVVVYDNLVEDLPADQVLIVVAHELAHAKHDDVLTGTAIGAAGALFGVCLLALLLDLPSLRRRAAVDGPGDARAVPLVLALIAFGSVLASPVQNSASRAVEARADRDSLAVTGEPQVFEDMQIQLSLRSLSDPTPPGWSQFWFGSHPTSLQRIGMARAME